MLLGRALTRPRACRAWTERDPPRWSAAMSGLSRLVAADAQQEAAAIALLLRESIETPGERAALITPDRDLARRVSAELARHGITADDSAGEPLAETPAAAFLRLVGRMVADGFAPVPLLAVLKHPLCAGGMDRTDWVVAARRLERAALRGPRPAAGLAGLRASVARGRRADALAEVAALLDALEAGAGWLRRRCPTRRPARRPTCCARIWKRPRRSPPRRRCPAGCGFMPGRKANPWPATCTT